jgi:hypothetical protein
MHIRSGKGPAKEDRLGIDEGQERVKRGLQEVFQKRCDEIIDVQMKSQKQEAQYHEESTLVNGVGTLLCATTS